MLFKRRIKFILSCTIGFLYSLDSRLLSTVDWRGPSVNNMFQGQFVNVRVCSYIQYIHNNSINKNSIYTLFEFIPNIASHSLYRIIRGALCSNTNESLSVQIVSFTWITRINCVQTRSYTLWGLRNAVT